MKIHMTMGGWEQQKANARAVRYDVFVVEQKIPAELEWDAADAECIHAVALDDAGKVVGTGRLLPDGHIGRMAVRKSARCFGVGGAILVALMEEARKRGDRAVMLNAQTQVESFYARHGFVRNGAEFMEAGIPHLPMRHVFAGKDC
jgi:predicted GNAT family N-acyltransferase